MRRQVVKLLSRILRPTPLLLVAVCVCTISIAFGARREDQHRRVEADEFVLRGKDGSVRASLDLSNDGMPRLQLFDGRANARIIMLLDRDGQPGIGLRDHNKKTRIFMSIDPKEDAPLVQVMGKDGHSAIGMTFTSGMGGDPPDSPSLAFWGVDSSQHLIIGLLKDFSFKLINHDRHNIKRLDFGSDENGDIKIIVNDRKGNPAFVGPK